MIRKTLLGSILFAMIWALWAADPAASLSQQIRVGYPRLEGFNEIGPDREKSGYGYEFLQRLALYTDFEYQYLGFDKTWDENLEMLEKGEIDLLLSALKTEERLRKFAFSAKPIGSSAAILTVRAGDRKFLAGDYANWNGIRVGLVRDSVRNQSFTEFAARHQFTYTPVYFDTLESLLLALHQGGRIDAAVTGNLRHVTNEWILATFDPRPFYAAVRRENRKLLAEIDAGIDLLETHYPGLLIRL